MRIDAKGNLDAIREVKIKKDLATAQTNMEKEGKVLDQDRIEISAGGGNFDELAGVKDAVIKEVEAPTSPDKLRSLKAQIENGTYHVSSEDLAAAILGVKTGAEKIE